MRDFCMLLNVFRKVTCFAKRNFYKGFEAVTVVVSGIDACRGKILLPVTCTRCFRNQEAFGLLE